MVNKNKQKSVKLQKVLLLFLFIIVLLAILGIIREYGRKIELDRDLSKLEQEIKEEEVKKEQFLSSLDLYQSDFYLEEMARTKFNLKKNGEIVVVISENEKVIEESLNNKEKSEKSSLVKNNLGIWWNYFFGDKYNLKNIENNL